MSNQTEKAILAGGSTGPARQGKLIGLMGAEPADAARAKPILEQLCRRLE